MFYLLTVPDLDLGEGKAGGGRVGVIVGRDVCRGCLTVGFYVSGYLIGGYLEVFLGALQLLGHFRVCFGGVVHRL